MFIADWDGNPPAHRELIQERARNLVRRGRNQDRVIGCVCRYAETAVTLAEVYVAGAAACQVGSAPCGQCRPQFNRVHLSDELTQYGSGVARASTHFESTLRGLTAKLGKHNRHHARLAHRLPFVERHGAIFVRDRALCLRQKFVTRNAREGIQDPFVPDLCRGADAFDELLPLEVVVSRHLPRRCVSNGNAATVDRAKGRRVGATLGWASRFGLVKPWRKCCYFG